MTHHQFVTCYCIPLLVFCIKGPKYKRRWVELTGQTLVYAATQQDLLAGKVFAVREMKWVKADGDDKFQVRHSYCCIL